MSKKMLSLGFFLLSIVTFSCSGDMISANSDTVQDTDTRDSFAKKTGPTIVAIAQSNPAFSTLVQAVVKADLVDVLNGQRMFTVFAPTNDAFNAAAKAVLGAGNSGTDLVNALDKEALTAILLYHVSPGERFSGDVVSSERIRMMNKDFTRVSGTTIVGNNSEANLVLDLIDIDASNGVIHVIDFVLLP